MRKIAILILASLLLLCACSEEGATSPADISELTSALDSANGQTKLEGEYMLEITFGEGAVLYYALGDVAWDRVENKLFADFDQTYLGLSNELQNYYSDGKMVSVQDGVAKENERTVQEIFEKFPYFQLPSPDGDAKVTLGSNASGTTYNFEITDTKSLTSQIVGDDIYSIVRVLKKPQKDKTEYGAAKCIYTVKDGRIVSCRYEYDIKLFDTPAYIPGHSQDEAEYTIQLHINAKVSYSGFGDGIEIAEYSGTVSE